MLALVSTSALLSVAFSTAPIAPRAFLARSPAPVASSSSTSPAWRRAGLGGPLPKGISVGKDLEQSDKPTARLVDKAAELQAGASLLGITLCAIAGVGLSSAQADDVLAMLGMADLYNQDLLFTELIIKGVDAANLAGLAVLPLTVFAYYQLLKNAPMGEDEAADWACFVDDHLDSLSGHVCGPESFDSSDDGMVCIEDWSGGKLRWVCA